MILKRAHIKNFRAIRDCAIEFGAHTSIVGGNGAGKSTILRAIDRFYSQSSTIAIDDFFGGNPSEPIEIELTFGHLDADETEQFASRVHGGELVVARVFDAKAGRGSGKYYGKTKQHAPFTAIRRAVGAAEIKQVYNALRSAPEYNTLEGVGRGDQVEAQLQAWETAHPDRLELVLDDGQFLGFTNVGRGSLQRHTKFVFIPAVREASADAVDGKGAPIAELMELVVRSAIEKRTEIRAFQDEVSTRYKQLTSPEQLTELGGLSESLTATLQRLYLDAAVKMRWREPGDFVIPLPLADVMLQDDGFEGPVDRKGHGLQRAFILTLLQHLAHASAAGQQATEAAAAQPESGPTETVATPPSPSAETPGQAMCEGVGPSAQPYILPGLILAIEEPELYQHPTKQRHFARVLQDLSAGTLPGVAAKTQVIFASHSSLFVSVERFDEIRLARRCSVAGSTFKQCRLTRSSLEAICRVQERAFLETEGARTIDGLRSRLHVIDADLAEGFFAEVAVVVEGPSDRAAILAAASLSGRSLEENGIAVLPAGGKTPIFNPACVFAELGIPTYCVWDCDADEKEKDRKVEWNRALQRLCRVPESDIADCIERVGERGACFERDLEATLARELGPERFSDLLDQAAERFGLEGRKAVSKAPAAMTHVLAAAHAEGLTSPTLTGIIAAIFALRDAHPVPNDQGTPAEPDPGAAVLA